MIITNVVENSLINLNDLGYDTSEFLERWSEPQRVYHDIEHITTMLTHIGEIVNAYKDGTFTPYQVTLLHLCAWYHDIVYVPGSKSNERDSADLALRDLRRLDRFFTGKFVERAVMATAGHTDGQDNFLIWSLLDADLAGLGAPWDVYQYNKERVRAEYGDITDEQWSEGRKKFLDSFLSREKIYFSAWGTKFEYQAKFNMGKERLLLA